MPQLDPKILAEIERKRALMNPRGFQPLSISPYDGSPLYQEGVGYLKNDATDVGNVPRGFGLPPMHQPPAPNSKLGFFNYLPQTRGRNQQFRDYYSRLQPASLNAGLTSQDTPQTLAGTPQGNGILANRNFTASHEGFRPTVYDDPRDANKKSIGYGFLLTKPGAADVLQVAGIQKTVSDLLAGRDSITEAQAGDLVVAEQAYFMNVAKNFAGDEAWRTMGRERQDALYDMSYNMGNNINRFTNMQEAIRGGDWQRAAREVLLSTDGVTPSKYYMDVGERAAENANRLIGTSQPTQQPPKGISAMPKPDAAYRQSQQQPMQSLSAQDLFNSQFQQDVQVPQKGISAMPKPSFIPKGISAMPKPDVGYVQSQQAPQGSYSQSGGMFTPEQMAMMVAQSQAYGKNTGLV